MTHRNRKGQAGFGFIELMMVMTIIAVLAAILMPQARGYAQRSKVVEAYLQMAQCRSSVYEVYFSGSASPGADNWGCEVDTPSRYVQHIRTTDEGIIKVMLGNRISDLRLSSNYISMAPLNRSGQVMGEDDFGTPVRRWRCGSVADGTSPEILAYLPSNCR